MIESNIHQNIKSRYIKQKIAIASPSMVHIAIASESDSSSDDSDFEEITDSQLDSCRPSSYTTAGTDIEIITDLPEWMKCPWIEEDDFGGFLFV